MPISERQRRVWGGLADRLCLEWLGYTATERSNIETRLVNQILRALIIEGEFPEHVAIGEVAVFWRFLHQRRVQLTAAGAA